MPVRIIYDPLCDPRVLEHHAEFQQWINEHPRHHNILFDEAHVLNGFHPTTSTQDPSPVPHVTIRLSNATLRQQQAWYVLHWREHGGSVVLARPDNEPDNARRRARRKSKKQRQQERKRDAKDPRGGGGRGGGSGTSIRVS